MEVVLLWAAGSQYHLLLCFAAASSLFISTAGDDGLMSHHQNSFCITQKRSPVDE